MTIIIRRWDKRTKRFRDQRRKVESGDQICAYQNHERCTHADGDILLRGSRITRIYFYDATQRIVIYTEKEGAK